MANKWLIENLKIHSRWTTTIFDTHYIAILDYYSEMSSDFDQILYAKVQ